MELLREFQKLTPYYSSITQRTRSTNFADMHTSACSSRDYLRGIIDADGSVGYARKGFPFISLTTASTPIGSYLRLYAKEITGAERIIKRNTRDDIYNLFYTMEAAQKSAAHLYYPGCISLQRKHAAADSLTQWVRPAGMRAAHDCRAPSLHQPFTQMNCFSFATTSTRSRCCAITWSMFL